MSTRDEPGTVYTLHFDPPYRPAPDAPAYKCAGHYTGWALDLEERLADHEEGRGARLTQVQKEAGGSWRLASAEPGTRADERRLKQHGAARRCPICQAELEERRWGPAVENTSQTRGRGTSPAGNRKPKERRKQDERVFNRGARRSAGHIEMTPSTGPGPLERLVKELLPDLEPEAG